MSGAADEGRSPGGELVGAWLMAATDPAIAAELESIYEDVATAITARGPACWASGRCCNFAQAGHRLYVTGLEAAYTVARLKDDQKLAAEAIARGKAEGRCPLQQANLCGVHGIKPLGCRVYFCDRSAQAWQQELSEKMHVRVKALHERRGVEYRYGEWLGMLELFVNAAGSAQP